MCRLGSGSFGLLFSSVHGHLVAAIHLVLVPLELVLVDKPLPANLAVDLPQAKVNSLDVLKGKDK